MSSNRAAGFSWWTFVGGVATGVVLAKYWPTIWGAASPYVRGAVGKGAKAFDSGKDFVKNKAERFSDVIEEIKQEEVQRKGTSEKSSSKEVRT